MVDVEVEEAVEAVEEEEEVEAKAEEEEAQSELFEYTITRIVVILTAIIFTMLTHLKLATRQGLDIVTMQPSRTIEMGVRKIAI